MCKIVQNDRKIIMYRYCLADARGSSVGATASEIYQVIKQKISNTAVIVERDEGAICLSGCEKNGDNQFKEIKVNENQSKRTKQDQKMSNASIILIFQKLYIF